MTHIPDKGFYFDNIAADRVCDFFRECLRHSKGQWAGQPFELLEWQREKVIRPVFGWKRPNGTRRYRKAYIEIPKKQGKSSMAAGVALYLTAADNEPGAEVYCAASDKEQAGIVYREAESMVKSSPSLDKRMNRITSRKTITYSEKNSFFRALSKENRVAEGLNIHGLIFDELHVQRDRVLWDTLVYGGAARRQPLIFVITTAGEYDPESIGWEQHKYAEDILSGMIEDDSFYAYIAAADKDDDWTDPAVWRKANPSLGVTITEEDMAQAVQEARNQPAKLNSFLRYRLNIWTAAEERWIDPFKWQACGELKFTAEDLKGRACYGGLDKSTTSDISAFVLIFPPLIEGEPWKIICKFWIPKQAMLARVKRDGVPYHTWEKQGIITATDGDVVDAAWIERDVIQAGRDYLIQEIAYDPWNCTDTALRLQDEGLTMIEFRQGMASFAEPTKEFEKLYVAGELAHGNNPVLNWMAANVCVQHDHNENYRPIKESRTARIDGIVAAIMALARAKLGQSGAYQYTGLFG